MGRSYYSFPCSILSIGKDCKTPQRYPHVLTTSWRISLRSIDSGTIDQSASGKLRDKNAKESWALLEDLTLYDNECWNDPRDFAKPVKAISLPQDVPSTSDRRLIELKNQLVLHHGIPKQAFVDYASSRTDEAGEERSDKNDIATGDDIEKHTRKKMVMPVKNAKKENEAENGIINRPTKVEKEETVKAPIS
ncbi:hypothetical protein Tco_0635837 [Tanacetum coccineum]